MKIGISSEILRGVWLIDARSAQAMLPAVVSILKGAEFRAYADDDEDDSPKENFTRKKYETKANKLVWGSRWEDPRTIAEPSIYAMDIYGTITKYDQFCGSMGMQSAAELIRKAENNPNIERIVLFIHSGGGEGYAAREFVEAIQSIQKPVDAFVDDFAASAAAWIASGADRIFLNSPIAMFGSFGTYVTMADYSEYFKQMGIDVREIYAPESKDKNKDFKDVFKDKPDYSLIEKELTVFNDYFLDSVTALRGDRLKNDSWRTGKLYYAQEAMDLGLVDGIMTFEEYLQTKI